MLAWEQGTGKTIISIAAAEKLFELGKVDQCLVVGPGAFLWQWQDRVNEFTDSSSILITAKDKESRRYEKHKERYVLLPYSLFRKDFDEIPFENYQLIVCDEAQEFRNHKSKTHGLLKQLNREYDPIYRWALTGTAITNKLEDLYSILFWVKKTFLPPWPDFEEKHIVRHEKFHTITGYKNLRGLKKYLPNRVDRKTQADMPGQLPKLRTQVHTLEQQKEYKDAEANLLTALQDLVDRLEFDSEGNIKGQAHDSKVSKAFSKLRQVSCGEQKLNYASHLIQQLKEENYENKFVVFSYYKEPIYELQEILTNAGIRSYRFTGDEDSDEKRKNIQAFKEDHSSVLLCSNAGAAGLDLPFANQVIHLDIPFAFGTLDQRNKRIVRASSKYDSCVAHYLIIEDSAEAFFFTVVQNKGRLQEAILDKLDEDAITVKPMSLRQYLLGEK